MLKPKSRWWLFFPLLALGMDELIMAAAGQQKVDHAKVSHACTNSGRHFQAVGEVKTSGAAVPEKPGIRVTADKRIEGIVGASALFENNVIWEQDDLIINADQLIYQNGLLSASQGIKLQSKQGKLSARSLSYYLASRNGFLRDFSYIRAYSTIPFQAEGESLLIESPRRYQFRNVRANTCDQGDDSWYIEAKQIDLKQDKQVGVAKHARFIFKGVPVFYIPWLDFPLDGRRKSGFLLPIIGFNSTNGLQLAIPYYLNLAPNYDVTLTPHYYSRNGLALEGEFRYLLPTLSGKLSSGYFFEDKKNRHDHLPRHRYYLDFFHHQSILPHLRWEVNFHQVSDDDYYRDYHGGVSSSQQNNLKRETWLMYQKEIAGGPLSLSLHWQHDQILHNSDNAPFIEEAYRLEPELRLRWFRLFANQVNVNVEGGISNFKHPYQQTGIRSFFYPSVTWNFASRYAYIRPRLGVHLSHYALDHYWHVDEQGDRLILPKRHYSRVVPIASVDSGLFLERDVAFKDRVYRQTLEPRFFYVYIPYRNQLSLPSFDSEKSSQLFSGLFRENRFTGQDKINQANDLVYGLTSRIYDRVTGQQRLHMGFAQRIHLGRDKEEESKAKGGHSRYRKPDTVLFSEGKITDRIDFQAEYYHDDYPKHNWYALDLSYQPELGRVLNIRYRYDDHHNDVSKVNKKASQDFDLSFQWPIGRNYSIAARYDYSLSEHKALDEHLDLEYISPCRCWGVGIMGEAYLTDYNKRRKGFFVQFNFRGFGSVGTNRAIRELTEIVPGYYPIQERLRKYEIQ